MLYAVEHLDLIFNRLLFYTCRTSGGVAVIHVHTLCGVHSCTVSPLLSTALHTVIQHYRACTYKNCTCISQLIHIFREQQARVTVTTTLDPPLPQQTITTLAPFSTLPTSIHQHSLVSLHAFFQLVITRVLLLQEEAETFSTEKESMASESSSKPVTHPLHFVVVYNYIDLPVSDVCIIIIVLL